MWCWADAPGWATMVVMSGAKLYWASDRQRARIGCEERTLKRNNRLHIIKQWEIIDTRDNHDFRINTDRLAVIGNAPEGATHGRVCNTVTHIRMCGGRRYMWDGRKWVKTTISDKADLTMNGAAVVIPITASGEAMK